MNDVAAAASPSPIFCFFAAANCSHDGNAIVDGDRCADDVVIGFDTRIVDFRFNATVEICDGIAIAADIAAMNNDDHGRMMMIHDCSIFIIRIFNSKRAGNKL